MSCVDVALRRRASHRSGDPSSERAQAELPELFPGRTRVLGIAGSLLHQPDGRGKDPAELAFEHLPSFQVDVQRRWPSVEKARRLLGWEARIDLRDGLAGTVAWLREQSAPATAP